MKLFIRVAALAFTALFSMPGMAQDAEPASHSNNMVPLRADGIVLSPEAKRAVSGINSFSLDLYKRMLPAGGNMFLSPASVSTAVSLAYRGAVGQTANELSNVFHYSAEPSANLRASADIFATTNFSREGRKLQTVNSIWVQQGLSLNADYQSDVQRYMSPVLQETDFKHDHEKSRADINRWVATATHERITELLQQGMVTKETRTVLVNAVYWKGRWASPFSEMATKVEPFTGLGGTKRRIPLMHQRGQFASLDLGGVQVIELPYVGGDVVMTVFLPHSPGGLPKFEAGLTDQKLSRWLDELRTAKTRDTILTLPRMHSEWQSDLKEPLREMGASTAFSDEADFSGMAFRGSEPGAVGLKISHVIHKAWLGVDEEGAEAAAATAVAGIIVTSARRGPPPPPPVIFRADKPFLYLLRDMITGMILFIGRYVSPTNVEAD